MEITRTGLRFASCRPVAYASEFETTRWIEEGAMSISLKDNCTGVTCRGWLVSVSFSDQAAAAIRSRRDGIVEVSRRGLDKPQLGSEFGATPNPPTTPDC